MQMKIDVYASMQMANWDPLGLRIDAVFGPSIIKRLVYTTSNSLHIGEMRTTCHYAHANASHSQWPANELGPFVAAQWLEPLTAT